MRPIWVVSFWTELKELLLQYRIERCPNQVCCIDELFYETVQLRRSLDFYHVWQRTRERSEVSKGGYIYAEHWAWNEVKNKEVSIMLICIRNTDNRFIYSLGHLVGHGEFITLFHLFVRSLWVDVEINTNVNGICGLNREGVINIPLYFVK